MKATDQRIYEPVQVFIPGTARPQPRPRFAKGRVIATADPLAQRWINAVEFWAKQTVNNLGGSKMIPYYLGDKGEALRADLFFSFPCQPRNADRYGKHHVKKPDIDNLSKLILDCFVRRGLILGDDSRVTDLFATKRYCRVADAGCMVTLTLLRPIASGGILKPDSPLKAISDFSPISPAP
jgi:Holliday junction resolvase RusA-like endonuclease